MDLSVSGGQGLEDEWFRADFPIYFLPFLFEPPCSLSPTSPLPPSPFADNAGLMLGQRRRRWTSIKPALDHRRPASGLCFIISGRSGGFSLTDSAAKLQPAIYGRDLRLPLNKRTIFNLAQPSARAWWCHMLHRGASDRTRSAKWVICLFFSLGTNAGLKRLNLFKYLEIQRHTTIVPILRMLRTFAQF